MNFCFNADSSFYDDGPAVPFHDYGDEIDMFGDDDEMYGDGGLNNSGSGDDSSREDNSEEQYVGWLDALNTDDYMGIGSIKYSLHKLKLIANYLSRSRKFLELDGKFFTSANSCGI